jgi:hypothetical protein
LFFFYNYLCVLMILISTKQYITHMEGINAYVNKYAYKYIYICIECIEVWKNRMFYEVCCLSNNKDYVTQLRSD